MACACVCMWMCACNRMSERRECVCVLWGARRGAAAEPQRGAAHQRTGAGRAHRDRRRAPRDARAHRAQPAVRCHRPQRLRDARTAALSRRAAALLRRAPLLPQRRVRPHAQRPGPGTARTQRLLPLLRHALPAPLTVLLELRALPAPLPWPRLLLSPPLSASSSSLLHITCPWTQCEDYVCPVIDGREWYNTHRHTHSSTATCFLLTTCLFFFFSGPHVVSVRRGERPDPGGDGHQPPRLQQGRDAVPLPRCRPARKRRQLRRNRADHRLS